MILAFLSLGYSSPNPTNSSESWRKYHISTEKYSHSIQFSCSVMSDSLSSHELQHPRLPCSSPSPGACWNSSPSSQWCHPAISSSVIPFSSCLQYLPASGSFPMSQFFTSGCQSIGVSTSASVLPINIQDRFPLGLTDLIFFLSNCAIYCQMCFANIFLPLHNFPFQS